MFLTNQKSIDNLNVPCNSRVGFRSSFPKGDSTPPNLAVFLCPKFTYAINLWSRLFIMTAFFWQSLRLVVPFGDTANQLNAVTRFFAVLRDGFTLQSKGIHQ
jgi:hypothetical protein